MATSKRFTCWSAGFAAAGAAAWLLGGVLAGGWWANDAVASSALLDRAETVARNGKAEARITFARPVAYRRHAPPAQGQVVRIELDVPGGEGAERMPNEEYLRVPPMSGAPGYFVLHRPVADSDVAGAPLTITVQFDTPTEYVLRPGSDGRSLVFVLPINKEESADPKGTAARKQ